MIQCPDTNGLKSWTRIPRTDISGFNFTLTPFSLLLVDSEGVTLLSVRVLAKLSAVIGLLKKSERNSTATQELVQVLDVQSFLLSFQRWVK